MEPTYDVAVVGAGTMGSLAGLALARRGRSVLLLDQFRPPHHFAGHHGETRIYRQAYGGDRRLVDWAVDALDGWRRLERDSRTTLFRPTGVLNLNPADAASHLEKRDNARAAGLRCHELTPAEVGRRWPGFVVPPQYAGLFEPEGGVLACEDCLTAALTLAQSAGAVLETGVRVSAVSSSSGGPVRLATSHGERRADRVLVTAGTSVAGLVPQMALPVTAVRKVVAWFEADGRYDARGFPAFNFNTPDGEFYGFPSFGGGVKVGRHDQGRVFDPQQVPAAFGTWPEDEAELRRFLRTSLPGAEGPLVRGAACRYDRSTNENFLLGQVPGQPVWYATGFSGHGFKFAPVIGELLAGWVT